MRLNVKSALIISGFTLFVTTMFSFLGNQWVADHVRKEKDGDARFLREVVANGVAGSLITEDYLSAQIYLQNLSKSIPNLGYIVITDRANAHPIIAGPYAKTYLGLISTLHAARAANETEKEQLIGFADRAFYDYDYPFFGGKWVIHFGFLTTQLDAAMDDFLLLSLLVGLCALVASIAGLVAVNAFIIKPIHGVARGADKIAEGGLNIRIPVTSNDEVGELGAAFNTMAGKMKEAHEGLERKVEKRTKDLAVLSAQYRSVVEGSLSGIYVIQGGVFRFVNPAFVRMFGYAKSEEIVGRPWQEFATAKGVKSIEASGMKNRMAGTGNQTARYEFSAMKKDGSAFTVNVLSNSTTYDGRPALIGSMLDITEQKKLEKEFQNMQIHAAEERYYDTLLDTSPDCIKLLDSDGKLIRLNKGGLLEHGFKTIEETKGWDWLASICDEDVVAVKNALRKAAQGESSSVDVRHVTSGVRGASNRDWCNMSFWPIKDNAGKINNVLAVSRDITESKKAEGQVKELSDLRNKFIQIVSHNLRTPINAVRWNLEALLSEEMGKLKKEQKEFIHMTYEAEMQVVTHLNDLLTVMDIQEGRVTLNTESTSLESLLSSVVVEWRKKCEIKGLRCTYVPEVAPLPDAAVDPEKIRDVFEKMTENAVTYTPEGGTIDVTLDRVGGTIRFSITDTGIGIPKQEQKRIFTRFYRASNAQLMKTDSFGLGLSIAKQYVEQHGGTIGFTSEEGKGSTFWFELPIRKDP